jgi:Ca2+-binding EF-hand superfamily protein
VKTLHSLTATALVSFALVSSAAWAQDAAASNPFDMLDADHDGVLSSQEGQQHPVVANSFATADKDGDGRLSRDEFNAAFKTRQQTDPSEAAPGNQSSPPQSPPPR